MNGVATKITLKSNTCKRHKLKCIILSWSSNRGDRVTSGSKSTAIRYLVPLVVALGKDLTSGRVPQVRCSDLDEICDLHEA